MKKEFEEHWGGNGIMSCPGCGSKIDVSRPGMVSVNANIRRSYVVEGLWTLDEQCNNPMCNWSDIDE